MDLAKKAITSWKDSPCYPCLPKGGGSPSIIIHKSARVEIFRGIRVIPLLQEKEVSRKARKGAKKSDFLCAFARESCSFK